MEYNFQMYDETQIDLLDTWYDYTSVMHYGAYGFAIDRNYPTIIPLDPTAEIGQRNGLSPIDIERVQIFYDCLAAVSIDDPLNSVMFASTCLVHIALF